MQIYLNDETRAGARAVDLGGPSVYQGGPKFKIKHKSRCFQKRKLVIGGGGKHVDWGGQAPLTNNVSAQKTFLEENGCNACSSGVARNFKRGAITSTFFSSVNFFRQNKFEAELETRKAPGEYGDMLPRRICENLYAVMAILVLFEKFSRKVCLIFLPLILTVSPIMMHFVRKFLIRLCVLKA